MSRGRIFFAVAFFFAPWFFSAAQALTVSPDGGFSATGTLALSKSVVPVSCKTTFAGTVTAAGEITVSSVSFDGGLLCGRISALGLPWSGRANSDSQLTINGMQVNIRAPLVGGVCGPVNVVAAWEKDRSAAHFDKVSLLPDCTMDGVMSTSPVISVRP